MPDNIKVMYVGVVQTMCGMSVWTTTDEDNVRQVELMETEQEWVDDQIDTLETQLQQVRDGEREPHEVGIPEDEECHLVHVYPDGRIMSPDGSIDYRNYLD